MEGSAPDSAGGSLEGTGRSGNVPLCSFTSFGDIFETFREFEKTKSNRSENSHLTISDNKRPVHGDIDVNPSPRQAARFLVVYCRAGRGRE